MNIRAGGFQNVQLVGDKGRINFIGKDDSPITIEFPANQINDLIGVLAQADRQFRQQNPQEKLVFPAEWWEIGWHPDKMNVILSFRSKSQFEMSFQIHRDAAVRFREALSSMLGFVDSHHRKQ